jgi:hypothetical protein
MTSKNNDFVSNLYCMTLINIKVQQRDCPRLKFYRNRPCVGPSSISQVVCLPQNCTMYICMYMHRWNGFLIHWHINNVWGAHVTVKLQNCPAEKFFFQNVNKCFFSRGKSEKCASPTVGEKLWIVNIGRFRQLERK